MEQTAPRRLAGRHVVAPPEPQRQREGHQRLDRDGDDGQSEQDLAHVAKAQHAAFGARDQLATQAEPLRQQHDQQ